MYRKKDEQIEYILTLLPQFVRYDPVEATHAEKFLN